MHPTNKLIKAYIFASPNCYQHFSMKRLFLTLSILFSGLLTAQNHDHGTCGFDQYMEEQLANPEVRQQYFGPAIEAINNAETVANANVLQIPVVFHIVYATQADNISKAQILDGLRVLNEDFRRQNADTSSTRPIFAGVAADTEIEFVLAKKDNQGNCVDGITRVQNNTSLSGTDASKINAANYPRSRYLNIWVTRNIRGTVPNPNGYVLGYATFPGTSGNRDGVILRHDELGTIGTAAGNSSGGRTLTHEVGHYLGLFHTFFPGEDPNKSGCTGATVGTNFPYNDVPNGTNDTKGDFCDDTPPVNASNFGCNSSTNTCNSDSPDLVDQIENYMDYTSCQNMFSADQKARMRYTLSSLRSTLVSASNANFTGLVNPPVCSPEAYLAADREIICTGESVQFSDISEEGAPTSWSWSFPGGSPATSNVENPVVTYANPGTYDVSLTVTNSAGTDNITYSSFITVKNSANPVYQTTWVESFENGQVPLLVTPVDGGDGNTFKHFASAGSHQSSSLILEDAPLSEGEVDELISPAISTAGASNLNLFFDFAFAAKRNDDSDQLEVYVSRDCGQNWIRRRFYNSGRLRSAANNTGNFVPNGVEWNTETLNFDAYIGPDPILIKFSFENGGGNNFYIDNIRFGEGTDVSLNEYEAADLKVYPNPSQGSLHLKLSDLQDKELQLQILDLSGKVVHQEPLESQASQLEKDLNLDLAKGVYLLQVQGQATRLSEKLIIE